MIKPEVLVLSRSFPDKIKYELFDDEFIKLYELSKCYNIPVLELEVALYLKSLVTLYKPKKILEIGCGAGASTLILKYNESVKIDAVDSNKIRINLAEENFKNYKNVKFYNKFAEEFLQNVNTKYDFVFIDSIKRDYAKIWHMVKRIINDGAIVVFDDFLLYGYLFQEECEIPYKYLLGVRELKEFYAEIKHRHKSYTLMPIGNGIMVIRYEI